jgi:hypothetical protein
VNRGASLKSHRDIEVIGNSGSEEILPLGIAIRDIPARSEPSISETRVRGFRGVRIRSIGDFEGKKPLQLGIAIREIPTGELCGPQLKLVEDRCQGSGESREIGESEFLRSKDTGHQKSRNPDKDLDRPLAEDTWRRSSAIGVWRIGNSTFPGTGGRGSPR